MQLLVLRVISCLLRNMSGPDFLAISGFVLSFRFYNRAFIKVITLAAEERNHSRIQNPSALVTAFILKINVEANFKFHAA